MTTYKRLCVDGGTIVDVHGHTQTLERGKEYITSRTYATGMVTVFTGAYWGEWPATAFAGARLFTGRAVEGNENDV